MAPQYRKDISTSATKVMLCFHVLAPNYSITVADALPIELSWLGSFKVLFVLRLYLYFVSVCLFLCLSFPPFTFSILSHFVTGQWMQKFEWVKIKFASGTTIWMELASNNNLCLSFQTVFALQPTFQSIIHPTKFKFKEIRDHLLMTSHTICVTSFYIIF